MDISSSSVQGTVPAKKQAGGCRLPAVRSHLTAAVEQAGHVEIVAAIKLLNYACP